MRHRSSCNLTLTLGLTLVMTVLLALPSVLAETRPQGSLFDSAGGAWVERAGTSSSQTLAVGDGTLTLTRGSLHHLYDRSRQATTLRIDGHGLAPATRYLLLVEGSPVLSLATNRAGRVSLRLAAGARVDGWRVMPPVLAAALAAPATGIQLVPVSGREHAGGGTLMTRHPQARSAGLKTAGFYFDETPLCSADEESRATGTATVLEDAGQSFFSVFADQLTPGATYTVRANGIDVGSVEADPLGFLWLDATAGDLIPTNPLGVPGMAMFELPDELLPVSVIAAVQIVGGGAAVLAGDFSNPCRDLPPMPVEAGAISLCDSDSWERFGWFDWMIMDSGEQVATVNAFGLTAGATIEVRVDGTLIGSGTAGSATASGLVDPDAEGMLYLQFSTTPQGDQLPLPDAVLPISQVFEVVLTSAGATVLAGTADGECDVLPPEPVNMAITPLCSAGEGGEDPADPVLIGLSEAGWMVYEDGREELWIFAMELEAGAYQLEVDGNSLGSFTADEWGSLFLTFASDPNGDQLPLPEVVRPVTGIDIVRLLADSEVVLEGSFSDPCDPWGPFPVPVEQGYTDLCGDEGSFAAGGGSWSVYDSGEEAFQVRAFGLAAGTDHELVVDGTSLGSFATDEWGGLNLSFASSQIWGDELPLPEAIRPVSEIDQISLLQGGVAVLSGSFSEPCLPVMPPEPVEMGTTELCPAEQDGSRGEVVWTVFGEGQQELMVWVDTIAAGDYELQVDGHSLGTHTSDGFLFLWFTSTTPLADQLPLPAEVQPVSAIDQVRLLDATGAEVMAGSFSNPCHNEYQYDGNYTGLCDSAGAEAGGAGWWTEAAADGTIVAEGIDIFLWMVELTAPLSATVDGVAAGELVSDPWVPGMAWLSLGTYADVPVPAELRPVSGIDLVTITDSGGSVLFSGSFADPCVVWEVTEGEDGLLVARPAGNGTP